MFDFWENFAISTFLALLSSLKRSPAQVPKFKAVLVHVLDDTCMLLGISPPVVP